MKHGSLTSSDKSTMSCEALGRLITEVQQDAGFSPVMTIVDTYNRENRLSVKNDMGTRTTMTYNGDGQRITRQTSTKLTTFIWDGSDYLGEVNS